MSSEHTQGWRSTSDEAWGRDPICMGCRMPWPCEVATLTADLAAERAEIERLRAVIKNAARDLYQAEVHRQGVGWDDFCTDLLRRSQHALAAETIWQEVRRG